MGRSVCVTEIGMAGKRSLIILTAEASGSMELPPSELQDELVPANCYTPYLP